MAPQHRNSLPVSIQSADIVSTFTFCLKTHFYQLSFLPDNSFYLLILFFIYKYSSTAQPRDFKLTDKIISIILNIIITPPSSTSNVAAG